MSETLYRKYRPKRFSDVAGQEHIVATLNNQVKQGTIAHAYLFVGPRGVGKTTTARLFAASIESKGDLSLADEILAGKDIDVIEIDAASYSKVENVREIILENVRVMPAKRPYKIFIIDEVHMLSTAAFNALLKVIEEPPAHVVFILATTELHKVPATIISRCQRYDFRRIGGEVAAQVLKQIAQEEGVTVVDEVIEQVVRHADGSLRDAESVLGQLLASGHTSITMEQAAALLPPSLISQSIDLLTSLQKRDVSQALGHLHALVEQGIDLNQLCHDTLEVLRQMMLAANGVVRKNFSPEAVELSRQFSGEDVLRLINLVSTARLGIRQAYVPQLPLEVALVQFCTLASQSPAIQPSKPSPRPSAPAPQQSPVVTSEPAVSPAPARKPIPPMTSVSSAQVYSPVSSDSASGLTFGIDRVRNSWHKFLSALQHINASLVLILKTAEPLKIQGNKLYIGFKYPFHKDRMNSNDSRNLLEEQLSAYFGERVSVVGEVLPADYSSDFMRMQNGADEVELVADTTSASHTSLFVAPNAAADTKASDSNALIEQLVQAFGGRILET